MQQQFDLISASDAAQYVSTIERFVALRNSFKVRKRHHDLDTERGFVHLANSRVEKLQEIKAEIEQLQPQIKLIVQQADENIALAPKHKPARLVRLCCDLLITQPQDLLKLQQKISTLRNQVFPKTAEAADDEPLAETMPLAAEEQPSAVELPVAQEQPQATEPQPTAEAATEEAIVDDAVIENEPKSVTEEAQQKHSPEQLSLFD